MKKRTLGKTGFEISEVSLGTWQVGGKWGSGFDDKNAETIISSAIEKGVNFIDTADVYEAGKSEAAVGRVVRNISKKVYVATKCGRQIKPHVSKEYTPERMRGFVEASLKNTGFETLDLIQLHCPPTDVYYRPEIFGEFEKLKEEGKIHNLGVSVEKVEEALKAIEYPMLPPCRLSSTCSGSVQRTVSSRRRKKRNVGVIVRVPLASGLLTGKFSKDTTFDEGDHRYFNREGAVFDRGETFAGVDFTTGLKAVEELKELFSGNTPLAQWALRWILMFPEVSCVIPGASKEEHIASNISASELPPPDKEKMEGVRKIYEEYIKPQVHQRW